MYDILCKNGTLRIEWADGRVVDIGPCDGDISVKNIGMQKFDNMDAFLHKIKSGDKTVEIRIPVSEKFVCIGTGLNAKYFYPFDPNIGLNDIPFVVYFWEDEECRDIGESSIEGFYEDFNEAYNAAVSLYYNSDYPAVEVVARNASMSEDVVAGWYVD